MSQGNSQKGGVTVADVKWIKIVTDIFNNKKIKQIDAMPDADTILVIWFKLLCLAGSINESGLIILTKDLAYTDEMLATEFRKPINTVRLALKTFESFGMIELVDNIYRISNWEKYQNIEGLERIREQTRLRVAKHRKKQKLLSCNVTVTQGNATDKERDKETDKERDKDIERDKKNNSANKSHRFTPPTLEEVTDYCQERNKGVDPQRWYDFYTAKGWMIGKNKMKDWKAAVRTWENKQDKPSPTGNIFLQEDV
jgi:predicted phage replisome organizer